MKLAAFVIPAATVALVALMGYAARRAPPPPATGPTLRALYGVPAVERLQRSRTALVLVDFQVEFLRGKIAIPDAGAAVARASELLAWARASGITVVHVQNVAKPQSPIFAPGSPTAEIVAELAPRADELVVTKPTGGAFTKTDLDAQLRARGVDTIVVGGIMAHLAVAMSAQDGAVLGYRVVVASDATTTRDLPGAGDPRPIDRATLARAALAAIADRFADVMPVRRIVALPLDS